MLNNIHMLVIYVFFIKSAYAFCHFMRLLNDLLYIVYSLYFLTSSMLSILQSDFSCIYILCLEVKNGLAQLEFLTQEMPL